jgi:hypothetical protein
MMHILVIFALSLNFVMPLEACEKSDVCTTSNGNPGIVKDAGDCKFFLSVSRKARSRFMPCGFEGSIPLVCCPTECPSKVSTRFLRKAIDECTKFGKKPEEENFVGDLFRVTNGKRSEVGEFPHFAQLGYLRDNDEIGFDCGGALISSNFVLTAAHCVRRTRQPKVVRLGKVKLK